MGQALPPYPVQRGAYRPCGCLVAAFIRRGFRWLLPLVSPSELPPPLAESRPDAAGSGKLLGQLGEILREREPNPAGLPAPHSVLLSF